MYGVVNNNGRNRRCHWGDCDRKMNKRFSDIKSEAFLSDQQRMIRDAARKLGRDVLAPTAAERDST